MKVLILSTFTSTGGAAIAAQRLVQALQHNGVEATLMCRKNISWGPAPLRKQSWTSILERAIIFLLNGFSMKRLWATDIALLGQDITRTREFQEADVIHLHWVNQGFLSLRQIERIIASGKKVVWTMHDAWNALGAYHLKIQEQDDFLNRWTAARKARLYASQKIHFVTCSKWLRQEALASPLMANQTVTAIPNPSPAPTLPGREGEECASKLPPSLGGPGGGSCLFVAQNVNNPMKGMQYLEEAERIIRQRNGEGVKIIALGRDIPYISSKEEMDRLYASVDVFVLPSLSENLPNTIMEAMACGTPCVAFNVGGIPEMIDHKVNGYLARYKDAEDLANGILYVLDPANHQRLSIAAREKILRCYSEETVANMYKEIYKQK